MLVGKANNPSYGWRSLWTARTVLSDGLQRTIGTGEDTKVWEDCWIPDTQARPAIPVGEFIDHDLKVHHLISSETKTWNGPIIRFLVRASKIPKILSIKPSRLGRKDGYKWKQSKSGAYTVKVGYKYTNAHRRALMDNKGCRTQCYEAEKRSLETPYIPENKTLHLTSASRFCHSSE